MVQCGCRLLTVAALGSNQPTGESHDPVWSPMQVPSTLSEFLPIPLKILRALLVICRLHIIDSLGAHSFLIDIVKMAGDGDMTWWWKRTPLDDSDLTIQEKHRPLRIGIPVDFYPRELSNNAMANVQSFLDHLQEQGSPDRRKIELVEVKIPLVRYSLEAYYILSTVEGASSLSRYTGAFYGGVTPEYGRKRSLTASAIRDELLGAEVKRRILLGTLISSDK